MRRPLLASLAFALALTPAPRPHACAQTIRLPELQTADALGQNLFLRSGSTGMVMVLVRDNNVFFRGYGETAPGSAQVPTQTSIVRLCSLSKIFASDLLIKLAGDKLVRLDDPLQKFAPSKAVRVPARPGHPITLADLATHTSGLPREVGRAPRGTPHFTFPGYEYRWHWLPKQILKSVPGTEALYSNVGFDLLGDALERAAHKPYATLLYERTTQPLGMAETGFTPNAAQCQRLLQGVHDEGDCTDTQNSAGSSGLYSTAADVSLWLKYLLNAQNPAAQAVYIEPATLHKESGLDHAGKPTGIGLGWMHIAASDGSDIVEKTGGGAGFVTYIALDKTRHTALFVAVTDGAPNPGPAPTPTPEPHLNFFGQANNLLLAVDGLPPLPPEPATPVRKPKAKPAPKKTVKRKRAP